MHIYYKRISLKKSISELRYNEIYSKSHMQRTYSNTVMNGTMPTFHMKEKQRASVTNK